MIFEKIPYALFILFLGMIYLIYRRNFYQTFFTKVNDFWFYSVSKSRRFSNILYILFVLVGIIALADLRGEEKIVEANIPTQKTILLIDTSLSMLVEDVRPNRINKAVLIARHFIRNSFGHQVSLAVFADIFKQIVPFTDDIEILEARLQTIVESQPEGGSNISFSVKEALQFFQSKSGFVNGNIILITDGEDQDRIDLEVPDEINLVVIGLGSENGGKIPLRRKDGQFIRNKTHDSQEVISKLNKSFFESISKTGKNVKVWLTQSYSMPTEEILTFLSVIHENNFTKGNLRQRPVLGVPLIILFIILFILSVIFSRFKTFLVPVVLLFLIVGTGGELLANEVDGEQDKQVNPEILRLSELYKKGEISKSEKLQLAELYLKEKDIEKSRMLYSENLKDLDGSNSEDVFNFATALLQDKKFSEGLELYKYLDNEREVTPEQKEIIRKNLLLALNQKNDQEKDDKDNKDNKDKKEDGKKDKKEDKEDKKQKKDKQSKDGEGQDSKNNNDDRDGDKKDKEKNPKNDKNKEDEKDEDGNDEDKKQDKKQEKKSWEDIRKETELKKKQGSVKGVLKQIMNDDSNLQKKFINSKSSDNSKNKKDW